jgi:CRISPR-associated endoribonuclease Cas6
MQLHLSFSGSIILPIAHRHYLQSMIYNALKSDPVYAAALHDSASSGRAYKLFTFGQLEGRYTVEGQWICFPQGATLEIRSVHGELLWRLFQAFHTGTSLRLGANNLTVGSCTLENTVITCDTMVVQTCSPVVAYVTEQDGRTVFFSPDDPEFYALIGANARRKWAQKHSRPFDGIFTIEPAPDARFRKQVTLYKTTRITGWHGRFRLSGSPEMLDLLFHSGLGAKNSQGFGMFAPVSPR